ncbi:E3 ubiquitin-protein ligase MIEL1 [Diplonema papillatum]|nr:E3 ubiquitin-protein ligase MIEL1 [Diplonema papillatum]
MATSSPDGLVASGKYEEAIAKLKDEVASLDVSCRSERAKCYLRIAECLAAMERWEECLGYTSRVHALLPESDVSSRVQNHELRLTASDAVKNYLTAMGEALTLSSLVADKAAEYKAVAKKYHSLAHEEAQPLETETTYNGCKHYVRKCKLVCPECDEAFACRLCHDEREDHSLDRFKVTKVRCMQCDSEQPASEACVYCLTRFADYYCDKCHLYTGVPADAEPDFIWHCDKCGLCRKGGQSKFEHCDACGICWPINTPHECKNAMRGDCPVCLEDLHSSLIPITGVRCGHFMHTHCLRNYRNEFHFACPLCKRTIFPEMLQVLRAELHLNHAMPEELKNKRVEVLCNDCHKKNTVPFHFVAMECPSCTSLNTTQVEAGGQTSAQSTLCG